jgi:hypothetical protein
MPANDEFPRDGVISVSFSPLSIPSIVIPAIPGVVHVLTHAQYTIANVNAGGGGAGTFFALQVFDSATLILTVPWPDTVEGTGLSVGTGSWDGAIQGTVGNSMSITSNGALIAGWTAIVGITWYDV